MSQRIPVGRTPEDDDQRQRRAERAAKLTAHRGKATWGERLVPLGEFRRAVQRYGRELDEAKRRREVRDFLAGGVGDEATPVEGPYGKIAVFGGVYNNSHALEALLEDAGRRGAEAIYCLGDLGGFGPHPERVRPLLEEGGVRLIQGNYEESLAAGREDCNCGYADPRDNHFADLSYRYTERHSSPQFKAWMGTQPLRRRVEVGGRELLLVHGSPRQINEFLFHSTSPVPFLEVMLERERCDGMLCTHTGLHWHRRLPSGRDVVNVGVIGRPANDGRTEVWYALLDDRGASRKTGPPLGVELVPLAYDHQTLAQEMSREELPEEFIETIESGWWTTCLEILPARERGMSRY